jgi:hypothetical protein
MFIDLHCHSKYSNDNHLEPEDIIIRAAALHLNGVCFTEHHSVEASSPVTRMRAPEGFLILRGAEISTDCGHLLIFGPGDDSWNVWGRDRFLVLSEVIDSVHAMGGICIPAHPFRGWESIGDRIYDTPNVDGLEVFNGTNAPEQNVSAARAAARLGLTTLGGSDCHRLDRVGTAFTEFDNPVHTMHDLVREIRAGNCRGTTHMPPRGAK